MNNISGAITLEELLEQTVVTEDFSVVTSVRKLRQIVEKHNEKKG